MHILRSAALAVALSPAVLAADITKPSGFNVETLGSIQSVAITLDDGTELVVGGSFGNQTLLKRHPNGSTTLWAQGFQFVSGIAQSPITGDLVVGDSGTPLRLVVLRDINRDGDALDAGENVLHAVQPPTMPDGFQAVPFALSFKAGTDELYMTSSTFNAPSFGAVVKIAGGTASLYAEGMTFPGEPIWVGETLYVGDSDFFSGTGQILAFTDLDEDGDALDAGESVVFAGGFTGGSGLVRLADGSFLFSTGGDGRVARCAPDGDNDGVSDHIDPTWLSGFAFAGSLSLNEGSFGLIPGVGGDGELRVADWTVGTIAVRSAPLAESWVTGNVANNDVFHVHVAGAPGAFASALLTLDPVGLTVPGIGDLLGGISAPYIMLLPTLLDGSGQTTATIVFHSLPELVGLPLAIQGFLVEAGRYGLAQGHSFLIG